MVKSEWMETLCLRIVTDKTICCKSSYKKHQAMPASDKKSRDTSDGNAKPLRWLGYGFEFAGVLGIFSFAGYKADQKLGHSGPWLMITGFAIGFTGMMYLLIKETIHLRK
ncbi:MAG: AtpZ/AtpI family protein [Sedimentisphaerales bacterium]|nr:AtpZ/AtpI family protein [Sedimentisphaerales bacterium]